MCGAQFGVVFFFFFFSFLVVFVYFFFLLLHVRQRKNRRVHSAWEFETTNVEMYSSSTLLRVGSGVHLNLGLFDSIETPLSILKRDPC
jgi:hypothetical protein